MECLSIPCQFCARLCTSHCSKSSLVGGLDRITCAHNFHVTVNVSVVLNFPVSHYCSIPYAYIVTTLCCVFFTVRSTRPVCGAHHMRNRRKADGMKITERLWNRTTYKVLFGKTANCDEKCENQADLNNCQHPF